MSVSWELRKSLILTVFSFRIIEMFLVVRLPVFNQITLGGTPFTMHKSMKSESNVPIV